MAPLLLCSARCPVRPVFPNGIGDASFAACWLSSIFQLPWAAMAMSHSFSKSTAPMCVGLLSSVKTPWCCTGWGELRLTGKPLKKNGIGGKISHNKTDVENPQKTAKFPTNPEPGIGRRQNHVKSRRRWPDKAIIR